MVLGIFDGHEAGVVAVEARVESLAPKCSMDGRDIM